MCSENRILDLYNAFFGEKFHRTDQFRFEFTGCDNLNALNIRPTIQDHELVPDSYVVDSSLYNLEFQSPVYFDGWKIHAPSELPTCSRSLWVSVYIKEMDGSHGERWKKVDSFSKIQIADKRLFLNGSFDLKKYQDADIQFQTRKLNVFGFIVPEAIAGVYLGLLGILGFAGHVKIAAKLPIYNGIFFITCQVVNSAISFNSPGDYTSGFHMALAFAECVALIMMSYEQWVFLFLWDGAFFSLIALSVMGLGEDGAACARKFFGLGLPFVLLGSSIKAMQLWTCRDAHRAIQSDFSVYQALWDSLVSDPASLQAVREMEALLAGRGDAFVRCGSSEAGTGSDAGKRAPSGWLWA